MFLAKSSWIAIAHQKGFPRLCAIIIAFVLSVMALRTAFTSTLCVAISTSTNTGTHPFCTIGATVVGNPAATVITSSPGLIRSSPSFHEVSVEKANKFAADPETVSLESFLPNFLASSGSKRDANLPAVNHMSSDASMRCAQSSASNTLPDGGI